MHIQEGLVGKSMLGYLIDPLCKGANGSERKLLNIWSKLHLICTLKTVSIAQHKFVELIKRKGRKEYMLRRGKNRDI